MLRLIKAERDETFSQIRDNLDVRDPRQFVDGREIEGGLVSDCYDVAPIPPPADGDPRRFPIRTLRTIERAMKSARTAFRGSMGRHGHSARGRGLVNRLGPTRCEANLRRISIEIRIETSTSGR